LQQVSEQVQPAFDDLLAVDAREIGKIAGLRDHHLWKDNELAGRDEMAETQQQFAQQRRNRPLVFAHESREIQDAFGQRLLNQRPEHRFLALEIEIDRALGHPCPMGDLVHSRGSETLFGEDLEGRLEDLLRPRFLAPPPAGFSALPCRTARTRSGRAERISRLGCRSHHAPD
jgi:hypothetical protein